MASRRELRIDFFRGLALLIVLVDHTEEWAGAELILPWTLVSLGYADAAEIFIFLSGYVFAGAYGRILEREGFWSCQRKALRRTSEIYLAYLLASAAVIGVGAAFLEARPPPYNDVLLVGERPWASLAAALVLGFHAWGFDILTMYVLVLPGMPAMLHLLRRRPAIAWGIAGGLYLLVQIFPQLNLPRFGDTEGWYFNPLAWQFLFFLGICLGGAGARRTQLARHWLWTAGAVAIVAFGLFVKKGVLALLAWDLLTFEQARSWVLFYFATGQKTNLQPLRLLHFFALVHLTRRVLPAELAWWSGRVARPLVVCGQHSLEVYAFGLVLAFLGTFVLLRLGAATALVLAVDLAACLASIGFAYGVQAWRRRGDQARLR